MAPGSRMPVSLSPIITAPEKPHDAERARGGDGGDGRPSPDQYEMQSPYFIVSRPTSTLTTGTESKRHRDDETGACCGIKSRRTRWVLTISIIIVVLVLAVGVPVIYSSKKDKGPAFVFPLPLRPASSPSPLRFSAPLLLPLLPTSPPRFSSLFSPLLLPASPPRLSSLFSPLLPAPRSPLPHPSPPPSLRILTPVCVCRKDSAPQGPSTSHPDELPVILLTLPDNANVAVTASDTSRVAYQDSAGELNVAEYHLGDDYSTAIIDDDYPMTLMAAAKNGTPLAALSYEENQAAIFYVATNNTIQSREGLLAIPELRSTSSLSTLGLGVLPATKIAAVLYPDHFTAALFFQLSNASLVSYHMTNNLWKLDAVLDVDVLEGSYLAAVAYQASGATSAETRLFYQDASDSAIKEICGDGESKGEKWAECLSLAPSPPSPHSLRSSDSVFLSPRANSV